MATATATPPLLLTRRQAGEALGVHARTIRNWQEAGLLPTIRLGYRNVRVPREAVDRIAANGLPEA
jgi:excisionase family DNA binding protein